MHHDMKHKADNFPVISPPEEFYSFYTAISCCCYYRNMYIYSTEHTEKMNLTHGTIVRVAVTENSLIPSIQSETRTQQCCGIKTIILWNLLSVLL